MCDLTDHLIQTARKLEAPRDYFAGTADIPFPLPRNILVFSRQNAESVLRTSAAHHRGVLVFCLRTVADIMLDHTAYRLSQDFGILIFPHQFHHFLNFEKPELDWLYFTFELVDYEFLAHLRNAPFPVTEKMVRAAQMAVMAWLAEPEQRDAEATLSVSLILNELRTTAAGPTRQRQVAGIDPRIQKTCRYICSNIQNELTAGSIAKAMAISPSHLAHLFLHETGSTLNLYVREIRVRKATSLLANSSMRIGEIARACGYDSHFSFTRAFKRSMGKTPREYRLWIHATPQPLPVDHEHRTKDR